MNILMDLNRWNLIHKVKDTVGTINMTSKFKGNVDNSYNRVL